MHPFRLLVACSGRVGDELLLSDSDGVIYHMLHSSHASIICYHLDLSLVYILLIMTGGHQDGYSTRAIHVGSEPDPVTGSLAPTLNVSTTFKFKGLDETTVSPVARTFLMLTHRDSSMRDLVTRLETSLKAFSHHSKQARQARYPMTLTQTRLGVKVSSLRLVQLVQLQCATGQH
jgi:hypothetical protein